MKWNTSDEGEGSVFFQYNSSSTESWEPDYKTINLTYRLNTKQWKTASYVIQETAFGHRQFTDADVRQAHGNTHGFWKMRSSNQFA